RRRAARIAPRRGTPPLPEPPWAAARRGTRLVADVYVSRYRALHDDAGAALFAARPVRPERESVGRLLDRVRCEETILRRRHRVQRPFPGDARATRIAGRGAVADRGVRTALVHGAGAHGPGGGGAGAPRPRRGAERGDALRHVPADRRADRRAGAGAARELGEARDQRGHVPRAGLRRNAAA